MVLEKQLEDRIQNALGKLTSNDGIGDDVKIINALILRIREFNNKHPRMFWDKAKIELRAHDVKLGITNGTGDGELLIKTIEESKYFTIFRDRFAKISPEDTKLPSNTITRWDGIKKLFTPNTNTQGVICPANFFFSFEYRIIFKGLFRRRYFFCYIGLCNHKNIRRKNFS